MLPILQAQRNLEKNFQTPIDELDAMARILDPVLNGVNTGSARARMHFSCPLTRRAAGNNLYGLFLKDYHQTEW